MPCESSGRFLWATRYNMTLSSKTTRKSHLFQHDFNSAFVFHCVATIIVDELRQTVKRITVAYPELVVLVRPKQFYIHYIVG